MRHQTRWILVLSIAGFVFVSTLALVALARGRPSVVRPGSVLAINLEGSLPEEDVRSPLEAAIEGDQPVLHAITRALERGRTDGRVKAAYLRCRGVDAGWGKLQELRDAIASFRASGKKVYAYLEMGFGRDYYLASAADKLYLLPSGILDVSGLMSDVMFFKGALDKIGVKAELEHVGAYKSASEVYTRNSMSDAHREATNSILDSLSEQIRSGLAVSRNLSAGQVAGAIDRGLFSATAAKDAGLVDGLLYEDQVVSLIEKEAGKDFPRVSPARYARAAPAAGGPAIALVYADGVIVPGDSGGGPLGDTMLGSDTLVEALRDVREDSRVRAVVLRIDSPGGSTVASDAIYRETLRLRKQKPFVVSMSDVAASGGYYIAMGADTIVAEAATLTGSIGVISGKFNLRGLYDWIGLRREQIKRGQNADIFSDYTSFTAQQRRLLRDEMEGFYHDFVAKVGEARKRKPEDIEKIAQGRVWTGRQAREIGLVDELGGLARAIEIAREKARIPPGQPVSFEIYPRKKTLWQMFGRRDEDALAITRLPLTPGLRRAAARWAAVCRLSGEPVLAWAPDL